MNLRLNRIPNPRVLREVNLWPPVKAWLEAQGFTPHAEVFGHDIVAIRGEELWVIELKMCATYHAFNQASRGVLDCGQGVCRHWQYTARDSGDDHRNVSRMC